MSNPSLPGQQGQRGVSSVLIVDDDAFSRDWLSELCGALGIEHIHTADNGYAAVKRLRQMDVLPELIVCDIYMPDMDGIEFLEKLIERRYTGKLMLISGMDAETLTLAREIADASTMDFLGAFVKPVSRETLAYALKVS
jgi:YesN/AraC family two-component response regulator